MHPLNQSAYLAGMLAIESIQLAETDKFGFEVFAGRVTSYLGTQSFNWLWARRALQEWLDAGTLERCDDAWNETYRFVAPAKITPNVKLKFDQTRAFTPGAEFAGCSYVLWFCDQVTPSPVLWQWCTEDQTFYAASHIHTGPGRKPKVEMPTSFAVLKFPK